MINELKGVKEAENLLEELGFDTLPIIPKEVSSAISDETYPIVMETKSIKSKDILGIARGNEKGALIYINSSIPDQGRVAFTEAHELGHVCLHLMANTGKNLFECGNRQMANQYDDPLEKQANGFASGLLMPKYLIKSLTNGDLNWKNIRMVKEECLTSYEATFRKLGKIDKSPAALIIHKKQKFYRFVLSGGFSAYLKKEPLSPEQIDLCIDGLGESFPENFETVNAEDWVEPKISGEILKYIYASSITLKNDITYTLLRYDDDCYKQ